jgi:hypothetical protein
VGAEANALHMPVDFYRFSEHASSMSQNERGK